MLAFFDHKHTVHYRVVVIISFVLSVTDEMGWLCVCEYRLSVLASARAAEHLAKERKVTGWVFVVVVVDVVAVAVFSSSCLASWEITVKQCSVAYTKVSRASL